jgi:integrase
LPTGKDDDSSINEIIVRYVDHCSKYYVKDGRQTSEVGTVKMSLKPLQQFYGDLDANDFRPSHLETIRNQLVKTKLERNPELNLSRSEINRRTGHIVRLFRWCVAKDMVSPIVLQGLEAFQKECALKRGRSPGVRETKPVGAVTLEQVEAIKPPCTTSTVWAMIQVQLSTGMRPGEIVVMRTQDIDQTPNSYHTWTYTPMTHKTEHHGRHRAIVIGYDAQEVLTPLLRPDEPAAFVFSPKRSFAESRGTTEKHKVRVRPRKTKRRINDGFTTGVYCKAVRRAIRRANQDRAKRGLPLIEDWHPHQLRHSFATKLAMTKGMDAVRSVLGHSTKAMTQKYVHAELEKAQMAMAKS